jgi:organic hydroperoxide reductase OsmC/OhrA
MSVHRASIEWNRNGQPFDPQKYSRAHLIRFEHPVVLDGNAAKANIPAEAPHTPGADPEEMFVASISACHMLWFVGLASARRITVNRYRDDAEGVLEKNADGRIAVTRVTLRPAVEFDEPLSPDVLADLHHKAHEKCFIANSVKTEIVIEPR